MILIFARARDPAANAVVPWLEHLGCTLVRINQDEPDRQTIQIEMTEADCRFRVDGTWYATSDISAVWFRKGDFWFHEPGAAIEIPEQSALSAALSGKLKAENNVARQYFHYLLNHNGVRALGNPLLGNPNKLIVLHKARQFGLDTPRFDVLNRLKRHHVERPSSFITKSLSDGVYVWDFDEAGRGYFSFTESLEDVIENGDLADDFPLSLVQEKISKRFEIRAFYIAGRFYAVAIYSQKDLQTAVDFRKYNEERPNRNVPVKLPDDIERKLRLLFDSLDLNTGSVDLIVDESGNYVFLEINPTGQYGYISAMCNLNIDRAIATWLAKGHLDEELEETAACGA